jgi:hypothetical protein
VLATNISGEQQSVPRMSSQEVSSIHQSKPKTSNIGHYPCKFKRSKHVLWSWSDQENKQTLKSGWSSSCCTWTKADRTLLRAGAWSKFCEAIKFSSSLTPSIGLFNLAVTTVDWWVLDDIGNGLAFGLISGRWKVGRNLFSGWMIGDSSFRRERGGLGGRNLRVKERSIDRRYELRKVKEILHLKNSLFWTSAFCFLFF